LEVEGVVAEPLVAVAEQVDSALLLVLLLLLELLIQ
jgi:hypothetical protein